MEKDILKVTTFWGLEGAFETYCDEKGIYYKPYPKPIKSVYRVECKREELKGVYDYIKSIEDMPIVTLS